VPWDTAPPLVSLAAPFRPESYTIPGFGPRTGDTAGEYLPVLFLPDGSIGLVAPIQDLPAGRVGFAWRRYVTK
jgi:hypothetical protein